MRSFIAAFAVLLFVAGPARAADAPLSDVLKVPRPAAGEYLGLYLKGQKIGYMYSSVVLSPDKTTFTARTEVHFKAKVDASTSERIMVDSKVYEAKPGGKLLSFMNEQSGDGGNQVLEGTTTPAGIRVLRKRPGKPNETLTIKTSHESAEDADQVRVALKRNEKIEGYITDTTDLEQYKVTTTLGPTEVRTMRGVKVKLRKAETISEKEKVATEMWVDEAGRMLEIRFGPTMAGIAEPEDVAKRVDLVEVFALTRVTLPKPLPPEAALLPGSATMVMLGLPEKFQVETYRQHYTKLPGGKVEVKISAAQPTVKKARPLVDPNGGSNLKTSIQVESDAPEIKALAKKIAGNEKDAWAAAKKVSNWVYTNMGKGYGSSSDHATDILRDMKGDCTEHSLLTVSLLRALGIPAKRIDGVVYLMNSDKVPALYWHEWVEAYVGEWTQLDPTFGQEVADSTHFAVGEEARAEITPLIGSLQVTEVK